MDDPPLLELFTRLQAAGVPLGIAHYETALKALQAGYGLAVAGATPNANRAALLRLCRTLWVRSPDEQRLLEYHFEQLFAAEVENREVKTRRINRWAIAALVVSLLSVGTGGMLWATHQNPVEMFRHLLHPPSPSPSPPPRSSPLPEPINTPTIAASVPVSPQPTPVPPVPLMPVWVFWGMPLVLVLGAGGWWLVLLWRRSRSLPPSQPDASTSSTNLASTLLRETTDEIQVAQAVQQSTAPDDRPLDRFVLSADYLPVTQRQMKQSWRHLRRMVREGAATELDIAATVRQIAHDGMLIQPVLVPPRVNRTQLVLLIDQDGSMAPFHSLSERLAETARRGGRLGRAGIYYFQNCPGDYLYRDRWRLDAIALPDLLAQLQRDRTVVLIFSDGGAARGGLNSSRVMLMLAFLRRLRRHVRYVAWLNPIPKARWHGTTAGELARSVPMFEGTRQGLDQAIDALRGRHGIIPIPPPQKP